MEDRVFQILTFSRYQNEHKTWDAFHGHKSPCKIFWSKKIFSLVEIELEIWRVLAIFANFRHFWKNLKLVMMYINWKGMKYWSLWIQYHSSKPFIWVLESPRLVNARVKWMPAFDIKMPEVSKCPQNDDISGPLSARDRSAWLGRSGMALRYA